MPKVMRGFYQPDDVIAFGLPERCAFCPKLNHDVGQIAISMAFTGEPNESTWEGRFITGRRRDEKAKLMAMSESCTGHESVTRAEMDTHIASRDDDDPDTSPIAEIAGYRCPQTAQVDIATTFESGGHSLRSYYPQPEEPRVESPTSQLVQS